MKPNSSYWLFTPTCTVYVLPISDTEYQYLKLQYTFTLSLSVQVDKWSIDVIFEILFTLLNIYVYIFDDFFSLHESHISMICSIKTDPVIYTAPLKVSQVCFCFSHPWPDCDYFYAISELISLCNLCYLEQWPFFFHLHGMDKIDVNYSFGNYQAGVHYQQLFDWSRTIIQFAK